MTPDDEHAPDRQFAATLAHGIDILLAYRPGDVLLGNRDFVQRTGLPKSTVARLTHTLVSRTVPNGVTMCSRSPSHFAGQSIRNGSWSTAGSGRGPVPLTSYNGPSARGS
jgi:hypothetical protein